MEFWVGTWLHVIPDQKDSAGNDKRIIIKHLCFGPVETQIWYQSKDGQYYYEYHIIEGLQAGDLFLYCISKSEMIKVINTEIALCNQYEKPELAALLQNLRSESFCE